MAPKSQVNARIKHILIILSHCSYSGYALQVTIKISHKYLYIRDAQPAAHRPDQALNVSNPALAAS